MSEEEVKSKLSVKVKRVVVMADRIDHETNDDDQKRQIKGRKVKKQRLVNNDDVVNFRPTNQKLEEVNRTAEKKNDGKMAFQWHMQ